MFSRENRVILAAFLGVTLALVGYFVYETQIGASDGWGALLAFVLFGLLGVAAPQLYLARTDASVPVASRIRFTLVVLVFLAMAITPGSVVWAGVAIWAITLVAGAVVIGYEFRAGYVAAMRTEDGEDTSPST